jgi:predicted 2-oxoglutarate/Fe(II)-dependent dioxygenase YbiX/peroxiredoxin
MGISFAPLGYGEPAPWFTARSLHNPHYQFASVAGRHVALLFVTSLQDPLAAQVHATLVSHGQLFDDTRCSLFVVTADASDAASGRARDHVPGIRVLIDDGAAVAQLFGLPTEASHGARLTAACVLLDPSLRVMQWLLPAQAAPDFAPALCALVAALPHPLAGPAQPQAPVLLVPRVFEPAFCGELIAHYERMGGHDSGYMRKDPDGIRGVIDHRKKRRSDCMIEDAALRKAIGARIHARLRPEIQRVFRFDPTRMERYLVACYDAQVGGYFRPHRDNDGDGHRQFAVTINLNAQDYEGGDLRFNEYGLQTYRAPTGGACVFSCGLMHEAMPVTRGKRYAFLPFLYDDAAAAKREQNNAKYPDPRHHYFQK